MCAAGRSRSRGAALAFASMVAVAAGCDARSPTGITVSARIGTHQIDELRIDVVQTGTNRRLLDGEGKGRLAGPFSAPEVRQPIYFDDALAGSEVRCRLMALRSGLLVAVAMAGTRLKMHEVVPVELELSAMSDPGASGSGGDAGGGSGGASGTGGMSGAGGASQTGGTPGTGGVPGNGTPGSGTPGTGGIPGTGGAPGTGGTSGTGGIPGTGGRQGTGGAPSVSRRQLGEPCGAGGECASGHCADGVCCRQACLGVCRACNFSGAPGECLMAAAGTGDPRRTCADLGAASCDTNGACDGFGACARYPAGTICAGATCKQGESEMVIPASLCDGNGACVSMKAEKCLKGMSCSAGACR